MQVLLDRVGIEELTWRVGKVIEFVRKSEHYSKKEISAGYYLLCDLESALIKSQHPSDQWAVTLEHVSRKKKVNLVPFHEFTKSNLEYRVTLAHLIRDMQDTLTEKNLELWKRNTTFLKCLESVLDESKSVHEDEDFWHYIDKVKHIMAKF